MTRHKLARPATLLTALAFALIGPAHAADPLPGAAASAQDPAARALLLGMADFIARAPGLRVTMRSDYDAIQADGQRIAFGERRQVQVQRPDKFRVDVERSDGERGTVLFDGRWITAFKPADNVYARVEKPGSLDQALVYMVRDLRATLPLARMFTTGFASDLDKRATSVVLVEEGGLFDVPTDHLAVRSAEVDLQLWIARGPAPLPRRVVITYKNAPGQPQFRADLYDWKVVEQADAAVFAFAPPASAEQIAYLAPRPPVDAPPAATGELR